jgi:hypothetical protein
VERETFSWQLSLTHLESNARHGTPLLKCAEAPHGSETRFQKCIQPPCSRAMLYFLSPWEESARPECDLQPERCPCHLHWNESCIEIIIVSK